MLNTSEYINCFNTSRNCTVEPLIFNKPIVKSDNVLKEKKTKAKTISIHYNDLHFHHTLTINQMLLQKRNQSLKIRQATNNYYRFTLSISLVDVLTFKQYLPRSSNHTHTHTYKKNTKFTVVTKLLGAYHESQQRRSSNRLLRKKPFSWTNNCCVIR